MASWSTLKSLRTALFFCRMSVETSEFPLLSVVIFTEIKYTVRILIFWVADHPKVFQGFPYFSYEKRKTVMSFALTR